MIINKYRAKNLKEAMQKAKEDLGPDARMIHLTELKNCEEKIEIIAAVDYDEIESEAQTGAISLIEQKADNDYSHNILSEDTSVNASRSVSLKRKRNQSTKQPKEATQGFDMVVDDTIDLIPERNKSQSEKVEITAISLQASVDDSDIAPKALITKKKTSKTAQVAKNTVRKATKNNHRILQTLHECCIRNQVNTHTIYEILSMFNDDQNAELPQSATLKDYLYLFMDKTLCVSGGLDLNKKTVVFIGPTGVGKTTTLAKLAAQYRFFWNKRVGLITIDTYRIAAIEQLKTYSRIMAIPLKVALTPEELEEAIKSYDGTDLILIDTPGRSQLNNEALTNLEEFLEAAQPADVHLLMAVTMRDEDAFITLENFAPEYVQQLIFTKLDETSSFGTILNIGRKAKKPISYLTIGQKVPEDIETAKLKRMVDLFIAGGS